MFIWNMLGAMVLIPALGYLLLKRQTSPESTMRTNNSPRRRSLRRR